MKMLRSAVSLLNKSILKEPLFAQNRFCYDGKSGSSENKIVSKQNDKQIEDSSKLEKQGYHPTIENNFQLGIQISAYSTVGFLEIPTV